MRLRGDIVAQGPAVRSPYVASVCDTRGTVAIVVSVRTPLLTATLLLAATLVACGGGSGDKATSTPGLTVPNGAPGGEVMPFPPTVTTFVSLPPGYRIETVLDGLALPTAMAALPDGRLLITEQETGRVRVVQDGRLLDEPWYTIDVSFAENEFLQELGLVGVEVDPQFATNRYVYLYYTEPTSSGQRHTVFARLRDVDGRGADLTPLVVIDVPTEKTHVAGAIAFGGDAILLGVGDHEKGQGARDLRQPYGKILRIDRDGEALPDNPFVDRQGADPRVYAYGVRNPFGIAVDSATGRAYFTDNRNVAGDAVYALEAGADYGWPDEPVALRQPLAIYDRPKGMADIIVYHSDVLPAFDGQVLWCSFHEGGVLHWSDMGELAGLDIYRRDRGVALACNTGLAQGADGFVYFLDYGEGRLLRIAR